MIFPDNFIDQDTPNQMYVKAGLDSIAIVKKVEDTLKSNIIIAKSKKSV